MSVQNTLGQSESQGCWVCQRWNIQVYHSVYTSVSESSPQSPPDPLTVRQAQVSTVSVCLRAATAAAADRQVTLAEQVAAAAMRSSARTQDRHDTGQWPKGALFNVVARQQVCMSMFMEYAFMLARKSWACSPPPTSRVSCYSGGHRSCGFFPPLLQNWTCS